jgi:enediyne biosynthesis protein E4
LSSPVVRAALLVAAVGAAVVAGLIGTMAVMNLLGPKAPPSAMVSPRFVDETQTAGLAHTYGGGSDFAVGGGVAVFDCNADGKPDLYLAGGANPAALYRNDSPIGGSLHFTKLSDPATDLTAVNGAYPLDIDGDGVVDLVLLRNGQNILLRGLGDCRFEQANQRWGFDGGNAATDAFSATWEGGATLPTMAFGNYVRPELQDPHHLCYDNELVHPAVTGNRYAAPIPLKPSWCALSMLFSDWDRSGRRDLRVSNDRHYYLPDEGQEQLWRMAPGAAPRLYTPAEGWALVQVEGMGIASYDLNGDGYPEYYLTSQAANRLQSLEKGPSQPAYHDIGFKAGVTASQPFTGGDTRPSTAWHPEFADVNNDGYVDLFVSKGNVEQQPDYAQRDPSDLFLGQPGGTFHESAQVAGILNFDRGRGAALADFNLDGMLDLVEVNYGAPTRIWRNFGAGTHDRSAPMGNWIALRLGQAGPNSDAIGAWVEVRVGDQVAQRELTVGGGHAGGQLGWIHFGLGKVDHVEIRVQWPDGTQSEWMPMAANAFGTIRRGAAAVQVWTPGRG